MHRVLEIRICSKFDIFGQVVKTFSETMSTLIQLSKSKSDIRDPEYHGPNPPLSQIVCCWSVLVLKFGQIIRSGSNFSRSMSGVGFRSNRFKSENIRTGLELIEIQFGPEFGPPNLWIPSKSFQNFQQKPRIEARQHYSKLRKLDEK